MASAISPERTRSVAAFVGRDRELADLRAGLDDVGAGHGRLFLLSGEPGIGKTRLAEEISNDASGRGMRVVWGRCWEGGGAPAYWPFIQILRACVEGLDGEHLKAILGSGASEIARLIPEIKLSLSSIEEAKAATDSESARFRLFDAVATLLKNLASSGPLLMVVDDLHDADRPALQMLRFVARETKDASILMLGTYRDAEVRQSPELGKLIGDLIREGRTVSILGLSRDEVGEFIELSSAKKADDKLVADLYHATDGNPLFVDGVVRLLAAEGKLERTGFDGRAFKIPDGVRESIRRRLAALSDDANSLLSIASVIGNEYEMRLLARVSGRSPEQIVEQTDEAVRIGVLKTGAPGSARQQFAHALIRDVLYDDLAANRRIDLHGDIGAAIEEIYNGDLTPHLTQLAHHYVEAILTGAADKAIDYTIRAGDAANAVFAYNEAISLWETALMLMDRHGGDTEKRADLLARLGVLLQENDTRLGIEHLESAVKAYDELNLPEQAAFVRQRLGQILASPGERMDSERALLHLRKAEAVMSKGQESGPLAALYYGLAQVASNRCLVREALAAFTRAMEIAERVGAEGAWCASATQVVGSLHCFGRMSEGRELLARVWDRLPLIKDGSGLFGTTWAGGGSGMVLWDFRVARAWCQKGVESPMLAKYQRDLMRFEVGRALFHLGDLREAHRHFMELEQSVRDEYFTEQFFAYEHCDWERLRTIREADLDQARRTSGGTAEQQYTHPLAHALRELGEYAKAEEVLQTQLGRFAEEESQLQNEMVVRPELVLNYVIMGRLEKARAQIMRCAEIVAAGEDWRGLAGHYHRAAAVCAAAEGNANEGEHHFATAVQAFRRMSLPWHEADTLQFWGRALTSADQAEAAGVKFNAAIEIYRRIGASERWIERVLADRARAGSHARTTSEKCSPEQNVFRKQGEYWTVSFGGAQFNLKDAKGLHYIAYLLAHPSEEIRALDLVTRIGGGGEETAEKGNAKDLARSDTATGDLGHAGEILDAQAKAAYQRRLTELEDEIEEAREFKDEERIAKAEDEIEALGRELRGAIGLAGRDRRAASSSERARIAVTKAIRLSLGKVAENNPALGKLLSTAIKTGTVCAYVPDDRFPITWRL
jgi:tetratricopeptide (TPR) repeat protein